MRSKGYCNRSVCLLVGLCTSHSSLVSSYITQRFGQLGSQRLGIEANKNGFSRVRFVIEKRRGKTLGLLYAHACGAVPKLRLAKDLPALQGCCRTN